MRTFHPPGLHMNEQTGFVHYLRDALFQVIFYPSLTLYIQYVHVLVGKEELLTIICLVKVKVDLVF
jgi:hypothetical protein